MRGLREEPRCFFFGNPHSGELHVSICLWPSMNHSRLRTFATIGDALGRGFNGCRFHLAEVDSG
jgi:hypothetical protein